MARHSAEREETRRRVLADRFVVCGTRRVQGSEISVYARPGRC